MDKNTITGLVLIGLLFLGFMWLSPKPEPTSVNSGDAAQTEQVNTVSNGLDSLSQSELGWLKENIRANGAVSVVDSVATYNLAGDGYNLSLSND